MFEMQLDAVPDGSWRNALLPSQGSMVSAEPTPHQVWKAMPPANTGTEVCVGLSGSLIPQTLSGLQNTNISCGSRFIPCQFALQGHARPSMPDC